MSIVPMKCARPDCGIRVWDGDNWPADNLMPVGCSVEHALVPLRDSLGDFDFSELSLNEESD